MKCQNIAILYALEFEELIYTIIWYININFKIIIIIISHL